MALREKYTHRIGNLVLLPRRKNSEAQNYDFDVKKQKYFFCTQRESYALQGAEPTSGGCHIAGPDLENLPTALNRAKEEDLLERTDIPRHQPNGCFVCNILEAEAERIVRRIPAHSLAVENDQVKLIKCLLPMEH